MPVAESLYLDPSIRDWVLFPITLVMILVGLLRHYVTLLLNTPPKKQPASVVKEQRALLRSQLLRQSSTLSPLPPHLYTTLSNHLYTQLSTGALVSTAKAPSEKPEAPANPLADPTQMEGMMDGMKKQAVMMIPNMVIMQWINVFFSGFVLIKLPFPLTYGFKSMLQRDIATPDMPVHYVSALSWYFLNLFGLNGLFKLLLTTSDQPDGARDMNVVHALGGAAQGGPQMGVPDVGKVHRAEAENLALADGMYRWAGEGVEERVLALWGMAEVAR
ncbi:hypothetical protein QFC20_006957 [Naganishia adeliensis]|uniref:Uncharacterized protein n=1 Tax=Naganishia adeliensis TaxID=92952 RepID=A0ACC2V4N2_9TREE|nr:hypothetical protein QFC20_006957 [Naganishia adeliensis]